MNSICSLSNSFELSGTYCYRGAENPCETLENSFCVQCYNIYRNSTGSPSSLYEPHKEHNMASNYKGLYGIFYKITVEVVEIFNFKYGLPYSIRVLFAPGVVILPI